MSEPVVTCPKCDHCPRPGAPACARCGLVFALWSPRTGLGMTALDERAEDLWKTLGARWDDEAAHDAFLKHCSMAGLLGPAGRRYRQHLDAHPGDALATRMQDRIISMATVSFARASTPPAPVTRSRWFWLVLGLGAVGGVLGGLLFGR